MFPAWNVEFKRLWSEVSMAVEGEDAIKQAKKMLTPGEQ